ncbi:MAG: DUF559 domain-containing protein [Pseudonocardiaceae bacterium]|nr:DUF559 domain-containing protein [Pseudonocardiaceae bacterium]
MASAAGRGGMPRAAMACRRGSGATAAGDGPVRPTAAGVIHNWPVIHSSVVRCWHREVRDRDAPVMPELRGPFRGSEAIRAGLVTRDVLRGPRFRKLGVDVFAAAELPSNLANRSRGVALRLNGDGVLSGYSAAEVLGSGCVPGDPNPRARWRRRVTGVIDLSDPRAESPMETRSRLVLVLRGLPRPELQFTVYDIDGVFVARVDMAYPRLRLAVEYDGRGHLKQWQQEADAHRANLLDGCDWSVLRFTSTDVYGYPDEMFVRVQSSVARRSRLLLP